TLPGRDPTAPAGSGFGRLRRRTRWDRGGLDVPPLEHAIEGLSLDAENARGGALVTGHGFQDALDIAALQVLEDDERRRALCEEDAVGALERAHLLRKVAHGNALEGRERDGALDAILHLAHVARPPVRHELLRRLGREAGDALVGARRSSFEKVL